MCTKTKTGLIQNPLRLKKILNKIIELYQKAQWKGYSDYSIYNQIRESIGGYRVLWVLTKLVQVTEK